VIAQRSGQHGSFDVATVADEIVNRIVMLNPDHVLLDDRPFIEILGDIVAGRADQLDTALECPVIGLGTDE
jgi:hypothetical protein